MSARLFCSPRAAAGLWSVMLRLLPLLGAGACGGFYTPPQDVAVGLALTSPSLPPRLEKDGHVLVLQRLDATLAASARPKQEESEPERLQEPHAVGVELSSAWSEVARGPLDRGDWAKVRLEVSALAVSGTYDGAPFRVEAPEARTVELSCERWRVELGRVSAVSLVANPGEWLGKAEGGQLEPLSPRDPKAATELMSRFTSSLKAVRDDDHDGAEDPSSP